MEISTYLPGESEVSKFIFDDSNIANATLHAPIYFLSFCQYTEPWSQFGTIVTLPPPCYTLTYTVDGVEYKSYELEEGVSITPETAPTKEGYTFSGWSEIPKTMLDNDVIVTGTFSINKYTLLYKINGEVYKSFEIEYGAKSHQTLRQPRKGIHFLVGVRYLKPCQPKM